MEKTIHGEADMKAFGSQLGALLRGGEVIELVGDVGAGKTTLTKGIADGMRIGEDIQSPSFTISRVYDALSSVRLAHYDFYRLHDAGIMADELHETMNDPETVTIIEWAEIIAGVLPDDRLTITIAGMAGDEHARKLQVQAGGARSRAIVEKLV
ncbi:tRNA (adenosine(37)-N6)-threonylcarbamoyltransferase complex ATPase subunit type 1 TsaE [Streptomyces caniscabiei]|uniref:tRNA (adenosine(37)-N6)-threonylcarbamoyltransferase complex ATPase subunit type 1 TsaE n=1 Tax=Streptomyces caniscabiei TaxID=2746961 RepID=UPI0029A2BE66|nr:tRNA (adenosine(37)-N6)-threonylcarbamoyltransferase complex ATPase subunit type 1 TsaE [Streptomyces caniscabiei]MDX2776572.1 tRNA (adenosine(37)-N6)-threonylcarbamoyltransferase complex ATPase subunit type 1 TsaE [Streptomyces caniscabiei]